ncbi:sulfatase [Haloplanus salinarum]|uniref:sulfatase n=1 Tax=Haloplanus salinarum TaxID=1912324 RepID=UPI00214B654E|nr:sulfatase [Haloplanus salinarum]
MSASPPNVLLLSLDSLRADHLPTAGYARDTAPALTEFADRSDVTVFENAFATTAWTLPSHTSLFTGLPTIRHGLYDKGLRIDPEHTLAAHLSNAGYDTVAFLNNGWLTNGGVTDAFDEVIEIFNQDISSGFVERNLNRLEMLFSMQDSGADDSIRRFRKRLDGPSGSRDESPFFAFFHLMEPHYLYNPRRPYHKQYVGQSVMRLLIKQREIYTQRGKYFAGETSISPKQMRGFVDLYDSEIRYLDDRISTLFDDLRRADEFDNSLIVVVGDHGELFGEHDLIGHHFSLADELLHVPLFVKWPHGTNPLAATRSNASVSLSNVFKTVLDVAGVEPSTDFDRVSLQEQHANDNRRIFAHYRAPESMLESFRDQVARPFSYDDEYDTELSLVRDGTDTLVVAGDDVRLYDLSTDAGETNDLSDDRPERVAELRTVLDEHLSQEPLATQSTDGFSEGVQQQLEDLGYI